MEFNPMIMNKSNFSKPKRSRLIQNLFSFITQFRDLKRGEKDRKYLNRNFEVSFHIVSIVCSRKFRILLLGVSVVVCDCVNVCEKHL